MIINYNSFYNVSSMTYNGINIRKVLKGTVDPVMILWFIVAFTAYFVKGLCDFANTLVFTTILSFGAANGLESYERFSG